MRKVAYEDYKKLKWYQKPFFTTIHHFSSVEECYKAHPKKWIYNFVFAICLITILVFFGLDVNFFKGIKNPNWAKLGKMIDGFIHPNWAYMFGLDNLFTFDKSVVYQVIETFAISFVGTLIASLLALPFGFLASSRIVGKWGIISKIILIIIRTFPELLLGYIFIQVFGFGALTGVMVISIHSVGMIGKMYSEQLDLISNEPLEALDAVGAAGIIKIKEGVLPQVWPNFLSTILYRFDLNIRTAALLGLVGAGGVGYPISVYSANEHWPELASVLYGVIFLIIVVDLVSGLLRKKLL